MDGIVVQGENAPIYERFHDYFKRRPGCDRVPDSILDKDDDIFKPKVVSIGPLHYHDDLRIDDGLKEYVQRKLGVQEINYEMRGSIEKMLDYYPEEVQRKHELFLDAFVSMCVRDTCFLLYIVNTHLNDNDCTSLLRGKRILELCISDLFVLENQLPWPLLDQMNTMIFGKEKGRDNIARFLYAVIHERFTDSSPEIPESFFDESLHLVDLLRRVLLVDYLKPNFDVSSYSAKQLYDEGVSFVASQSEKGIGFIIGDLQYSPRMGRLSIPFLSINNVSRFKRIFLNLVAYEGSLQVEGREMTTFMEAITVLLRDADSIKIGRKKFLSSSANSPKVAGMFSEIASHLSPRHTNNTNNTAGSDKFVSSWLCSAQKWWLFSKISSHPSPRHTNDRAASDKFVFSWSCLARKWCRECFEAILKSPYKIIALLVGIIFLYWRNIRDLF